MFFICVLFLFIYDVDLEFGSSFLLGVFTVIQCLSCAPSETLLFILLLSSREWVESLLWFNAFLFEPPHPFIEP